MAQEQYLTYEQVLQELQTNRGQLNQFIRSGRLKQHVVGGETKFRADEVGALKGELGKEPTVMEDWDDAKGEAGTAILDGGLADVAAEPETEVIEENEVVAQRTTDILEEPAAGQEPDTVMLEESSDEISLDSLDSDLELQLEDSDTGLSPSASALETELDLTAVQPGAAPAAAQEEEDFFDFSGDLEDVEFELEAPDEESGSDEMVIDTDSEEVVTEILDLGETSEIAEEDLLSEIMEIDDDLPLVGDEALPEDSADITAEITTMEEPTYEESDLDELLSAEEEVGFDEEFAAEEEFEVPYAAPIAAPGEVGVLWVCMLLATLVVLLVGGLFAIENNMDPRLSTKLTGWAPFGPESK